MIPKYQFLIYYQKQIYLLEFFTDFVYRNRSRELLIIICQFLNNWQIILSFLFTRNFLSTSNTKTSSKPFILVLNTSKITNKCIFYIKPKTRSLIFSLCNLTHLFFNIKISSICDLLKRN